jgi:hypothetical protein
MDVGTHLVKGMYRSRRLLDLAHEVERCQNCGRFTGGCEPAHSNELEHGRGSHHPSHDCYFAALCHDCHAWYDHGKMAKDPSGLYECSREGKREMHTRAMLKTWLWLWSRGKVRVH